MGGKFLRLTLSYHLWKMKFSASCVPSWLNFYVLLKINETTEMIIFKHLCKLIDSKRSSLNMYQDLADLNCLCPQCITIAA